MGTMRPLGSVGTRWTFWLLIVVLLAVSVAIFRIASPRREVLASLHMNREALRFVPQRVQWGFWSQPNELMVTANSREILLCRCFREQMFEGYSLIVRGTVEPERAMKIQFPFIPDVQDCGQLATAINSATGLPIRLVTRRCKLDGTFEETPWAPVEPGKNIAPGLAGVTGAVLPFIGGAVVGYFWPSPAIIVGAGLVLWLGQLGAMSVSGRKCLSPKVLSTLVPFATWYAIAAIVGARIIRTH